MNRQGWQCPNCKVIHSPDIVSCHCSAGGLQFEVTMDGWWQCRGCKVWIPKDQAHYCYGTYRYGTYTVSPYMSTSLKGCYD